MRKLKEEVGSDYVTAKPTDKPFRKDDPLTLPIVCKDMTGRLFTQKIKAISDIIAHYNTSHFALRLCVAPEKLEHAKEILFRFKTGITQERAAAEVRSSERALELAKQNPDLNSIPERASNGKWF